MNKETALERKPWDEVASARIMQALERAKPETEDLRGRLLHHIFKCHRCKDELLKRDHNDKA